MRTHQIILPLLTSPSVWSQVLKSLGNVRSIFAENDQVATGLKKFVFELVSPAADKIGWEFAADEDLLTGQLRSLLISSAGGAGHQGYVCIYA